MAETWEGGGRLEQGHQCAQGGQEGGPGVGEQGARASPEWPGAGGHLEVSGQEGRTVRRGGRLKYLDLDGEIVYFSC